MKHASKKIREVCDDYYQYYLSDDGHTMRREYSKTPGGNLLNGRWVLRAPDGTWIDFDQHRFDLAERHGFSIEYNMDADQNKENANAAGDRPS